MLKNAFFGIQREKKTLMQVVDFHNTQFEEKVKADLKAPATLAKWKTTKTKLEEFLKVTFNTSDYPLHKIDYAFTEDLHLNENKTELLEFCSSWFSTVQQKNIATGCLRKNFYAEDASVTASVRHILTHLIEQSKQ
jgi:hypothetical protein